MITMTEGAFWRWRDLLLAALEGHVEACSASGAVDDAVEEALRDPKVRFVADNVDPERLRQALREYGAWDQEELEDDEANLQRIVWLVCCDAAEENNE